MTWPKDDISALTASLHFKDLLEWRNHMHSDAPDITGSLEFELYLDYCVLLLNAMLDSHPEVQAQRQVAERRTLNELDSAHEVLQGTIPRLFLFLPSNLKLSSESAPSIQSFRLYFLCDCG